MGYVAGDAPGKLAGRRGGDDFIAGTMQQQQRDRKRTGVLIQPGGAFEQDDAGGSADLVVYQRIGFVSVHYCGVLRDEAGRQAGRTGPEASWPATRPRPGRAPG